MAHTATATIGAKMADDKLPKAPRCSRCKCRLRNTKLLDARAAVKRGIVDTDELTCAGCLTPEEIWRMNSNEAMYEPVINAGQIRLVPRFTIHTKDGMTG